MSEQLCSTCRRPFDAPEHHPDRIAVPTPIQDRIDAARPAPGVSRADVDRAVRNALAAAEAEVERLREEANALRAKVDRQAWSLRRAEEHRRQADAALAWFAAVSAAAPDEREVARVLTEFRECVNVEKDGDAVMVPVADLRIAYRALAARPAPALADPRVAALEAEVARLRSEAEPIMVGFAADAMRLTAERDAARAALAALEARVAAGEASDGHHTHRELYDYRMLYNAHAARGWLAAGVPVVKSLHHSDGEPCFGGGWFIVTATLPTGQVSNHYRTEYLSLFADVPTVDLPPEYDGHTPAEAANRLGNALLAATPSETEAGR